MFLKIFQSDVHSIFESIFELDISYAEIRLDNKFLEKVKVWLNNNPEYVKQAYKQVILNFIVLIIIFGMNLPNLCYFLIDRKLKINI